VIISPEIIVSILVLFLMWGGVLLYFKWVKAGQESEWGTDPMTGSMPRPPGESLRIRLQSLQDELDEMLTIVIIAALAAGAAPLLDITTPAKWTVAIMGISIAVWNVRKFKALRKERHNTRLGYKGERYVGQYLNDLAANGSKVYHDVPCRSNKQNFNIDHVVLGPAGVFVIETKARRKPKHIQGKSKAQVTYDGQRLAFPTFSDKYGLKQAERNAAYLSEVLTSSTGMDVPVHPVLVLPGWYVKREGAGQVRVLNPKGLASALTGKKQLNEEQIARIDHQLTQLTVCEDD